MGSGELHWTFHTKNQKVEVISGITKKEEKLKSGSRFESWSLSFRKVKINKKSFDILLGLTMEI